MADEMDSESSFDSDLKESSGKSETCLVEKKKKQLLEELEAMITTPTPAIEPRRRPDCEEQEEVEETSESQSLVHEKKAKQHSLVYSREKMEALRFVNMAEQRKMWKNVYKGLGPVAKKEYDGLVFKHNKKDTNNQRSGKKQVSTVESCWEVVDNGLSDMVKSEIHDVGEVDDGCSHNVEDEEKHEAIEGKCSEEEDDSDEEYASIQRRAFFVEGEPNFDAGPPEDGLEYLRRVRWEAAQIPKVKVAKLDRSKLKNEEQSDYMPKIPEIAKCPEHLLPTKQWENAFLAEFSQLRLALSSLEISSIKSSGNLLSAIVFPMNSYSHQPSGSINVESSSEEIETKVHPDQFYDCSGSEKENDQLSILSTDEDNNLSLWPDKLTPKSSVTEDCTNHPVLSTILKMDSVARVSMLKKRISSFIGTTTVLRNDCVWLFALCAVVDTPLDADTCASLRGLLRKSASLLAEKSELDDEVVMLNILATISGRYFGQLES